MIFDLHCDAIWKITSARERGEYIGLQKSNLQVDEEKLVSGGYFAQCFAVFIPNKFENPRERCLEAIRIYYEELGRCRALAPVFRFSDFEKNASEGRISTVLTMEDASPIGEDLQNFHEFYRLGARMLCLTHNYANAVGFPNYGKRFFDGTPDYVTPEATRGLTKFGFELVEEANRLGVILDVSHLSDKGFYNVIERTRKPIVASHSNARGIRAHVRNLSDDMLFKLAENGGVAGINYEKSFLDDDPKGGAKTVERAAEHIEYIRDVIGAEYIALGSDFDGIDADIELEDASKAPLLLRELERRGFSVDEIEKIAYKNALRVFRENLR